VKPFDTWADMTHVATAEAWRELPRCIAYFCNVLADPAVPPEEDDTDYPASRKQEVKENVVAFLNRHVQHLWPAAIGLNGEFRWELLCDPGGEVAPTDPGAPATAARFDSQYWTANVNPSDRYVLALPGTLKYRISPLNVGYDNLTIAGDWTDCGFNEGCVEAAFISGRLAAHAISRSPALADVVGYDHP
jgi:uncharacterized protein with NAD-binding domain and iron-sulfur cluster